MTWLAALLAVMAVGTGVGIRLRMRRRQVTPRRVEQPNSYYSAPGVQRLVDLERWGRIPLDHLHPLNRDEVRRLLRLARAAGADSLAPRERRFLDNIARSTAGTASDPGGRSSHGRAGDDLVTARTPGGAPPAGHPGPDPSVASGERPTGP